MLKGTTFGLGYVEFVVPLRSPSTGFTWIVGYKSGVGLVALTKI